MKTESGKPMSSLEELLAEFAADCTSEDYRLNLAGANGRVAQLQAFSTMWFAGAAKARVARQACMGNLERLKQAPEGKEALVEGWENMISLASHLIEVDRWFALRSALLGELLKVLREANEGRTADAIH